MQYSVSCAILYICKGFKKISIHNYNNNDEMTNGDKYTCPGSGSEFAKGSDRME